MDLNTVTVRATQFCVLSLRVKRDSIEDLQYKDLYEYVFESRECEGIQKGCGLLYCALALIGGLIVTLPMLKRLDRDREEEKLGER